MGAQTANRVGNGDLRYHSGELQHGNRNQNHSGRKPLWQLLFLLCGGVDVRLHPSKRVFDSGESAVAYQPLGVTVQKSTRELQK